MYAVRVELKIKPGFMSHFMSLLRANAKASLASEPGCHQFDVCLAQDDPDLVLLYELYDDAEAFAAHMSIAHFGDFDAATADMVATKRVVTALKVFPKG